MRRILVIDDELGARGFLQEVLRRAGYEVAIAADADEGEALYRAAPADVVIVDVLMAEKTGLEVALDLKREFPGVKIIAISGGFLKGTDDDLTLARTLGVERTCAKPYVPARLLQLVREVLEAPDGGPPAV